MECFTTKLTTTIIAEFLGNKIWVDPAIVVEANHRCWYCEACTGIVVHRLRMSKAPHPKPHPVKLEEKLGMPRSLLGLPEFTLQSQFLSASIFSRMDLDACLSVCVNT